MHRLLAGPEGRPTGRPAVGSGGPDPGVRRWCPVARGTVPGTETGVGGGERSGAGTHPTGCRTARAVADGRGRRGDPRRRPSRRGVPGPRRVAVPVRVDASGYLTALITSFVTSGAVVSIANFGDRVTIGGQPLRRGVQPGGGAQPHRASGRRRPPAPSGAGRPAGDARRGPPGPHGGPRLRRRLADQRGPAGRGGLRPALHPHAHVLGPWHRPTAPTGRVSSVRGDPQVARTSDRPCSASSAARPARSCSVRRR